MSSSNTAQRPIAVFHEHPDWFRPMFQELDRREIPYVRLDPRAHWFDPSASTLDYSLAFNRMSPSAYLRDGIQGIFYMQHVLAHLDRLGCKIMNGSTAFSYEISKSRQLTLLESLGLPYPKSRVFNHPSQIEACCEGMRFPVVVKANIGGSGAGIVRYDSQAQLMHAVAEGRIAFGIDHTALLQEYIPARGGHIVRVETLGAKFLYAIKVFTDGSSFNLCPADICQTVDGVELTRNACPVNAAKSGMKVEAYQPPPSVVDACEAIMQNTQIDVGGIEYMIDDRDGTLVYYDINALSNFVADAIHVVGFDPTSRLVDFMVDKSRTPVAKQLARA